MVHFWPTKPKERPEPHILDPGIGTTGDIAVIIDGKTLDADLVHLACATAKRARRKVHLVYIIEVPRTLPLKTVLTQETEYADKLLTKALNITREAGCIAIAEVLQARDAGPAIVDEAKDHSCGLLLLGFIRNTHKPHNDLGRTIPYVLANAPCRVWLIEDSGDGSPGTK